MLIFHYANKKKKRILKQWYNPEWYKNVIKAQPLLPPRPRAEGQCGHFHVFDCELQMPISEKTFIDFAHLQQDDETHIHVIKAIKNSSEISEAQPMVLLYI